MFINRGMDKEDVVQSHSGMSVGLTKMNEVIMHVAMYGIFSPLFMPE